LPSHGILPALREEKIPAILREQIAFAERSNRRSPRDVHAGFSCVSARRIFDK
jgi:hypothetical protein